MVALALVLGHLALFFARIVSGKASGSSFQHDCLPQKFWELTTCAQHVHYSKSFGLIAQRREGFEKVLSEAGGKHVDLALLSKYRVS